MKNFAKVGSVSAESVTKHTKKDWQNWVEILSKRGCSSWSHQDLVQLLKKEFRLSIWWQQEVARGYLIAIGVRQPNQTLKGTYTTTVTKSLLTTSKKLFAFLISAEGQAIWLQPLDVVPIKKAQQFECAGGIFGEFRTVTSGKTMRFTWVDEDWPRKTVVQLILYPKPKGKCMMVINHVDLPTSAAKVKMHTRWREAVDNLADTLASNERFTP